MPARSSASRSAPAPSVERLRRLQTDILDWYDINARDLPWRHTTDPYAILLSEVMLQQTQVSRVVPRFAEWLAAWPDLESLAVAPLSDVLRRWQGLGYNNRAVRLQACAAVAVARSAPARPAGLPRSLAGLMDLPGIGPYTARAVLIFAHNDDLAAVDANVRRVLTHELGLPPDLSDGELQRTAEAALPRGRSRDWHNALMDYGALVLTARATGISPRTRQGAFEGSRRQKRALLLRALLVRSPRTPAELASELGLTTEDVEDLLRRLSLDGLVSVNRGGASVA